MHRPFKVGELEKHAQPNSFHMIPFLLVNDIMSSQHFSFPAF